MSREEIRNIEDPTAAARKLDHIKLAEASRVTGDQLDSRFYYEPMLAGHPSADLDIGKTFLGKRLTNPIWVSSMTGGTGVAATINENLAKACAEFGMGMGLGSCRKLMHDDTYFSDFDVRKHIGDQPLYANLGIAQIEQIWKDDKWDDIIQLVNKLQADGLIIHVNPLQEWLQPEGDRYHSKPIDLIKRAIDALNISLIVKEVGQGIGEQSLRALCNLPLDGIEFAAGGGTNFAMLELLRSDEAMQNTYARLASIGHTADDMVDMINQLKVDSSGPMPDFIISGGVKDFLDGYHLISKCKGHSIYGQASSFLKHAMDGYEDLQKHVHAQVEGLRLAHTLLTVRR